MELVTVNNGEVRTTSLAIAEGTGNEHKAVIQLVRKYENDLSAFGGVTFEMLPFMTEGGMQTREVASLNERQATLLMSYMKNTPIIRQFKTTLVTTFYQMATAQQSAAPVIHNPERRALIQLLTDFDAVENRVTLLEAKQTTRDESYFTVAGYCNLKGIKLDRAGMAMVGKMAASYSREHSLKIGKVYDSRYGEVNEYHTSALQYAVEA